MNNGFDPNNPFGINFNQHPAAFAAFLADLQQQQQALQLHQGQQQQLLQPQSQLFQDDNQQYLSHVNDIPAVQPQQPQQQVNQRPQRLAAQASYQQHAAVASITASATPSSASFSRGRSYFTPEQVNEMEVTFQRNNVPDREAMEFLAQNIKLKYEQVRKWMSRRRIKEKEKGQPSEDFQRDGSVASDEFLEVDETTPALPTLSTPTSDTADEPASLPPPQAAPITIGDIDFEEPAHVTRFLRFLNAANGVEERKERINLADEFVSDEFYQALAQAKGFKGLILLRQWIQESKDNADLLALVLDLLEKLPITLEGLIASKLGKAVSGVIKIPGLNDETKGMAKQLTASWTELVQKAKNPAPPVEEVTPVAPAPAQVTATDRQRIQREKEEAIAAAASAKVQSLLSKKAQKREIDQDATAFSSTTASSIPPEIKYARYRKVAKITSPTDTSTKTGSPEPVAVILNEHGVKSILSTTVTPDVDPANPRKKKKGVTFAVELVKTRYFNTDDDVMAAGDRHFKNKSARDSEKGEGRAAFHKDSNREIKATREWKTPRPMAMQIYPSPTSTPETLLQDARERIILSVTYYVDEDIPDTPTEPDVDYGEDDDVDVSLEGGGHVECVHIPLDDAESSTPVVAAPPVLSGLGGLNALFSASASTPAAAPLGIPKFVTPAQPPTNALNGLNFLLAFQQQQQAKPDVSNLLKVLGVAAPPSPAPPSSQPAASNLPLYLHQQQQPQVQIPSLPFLQQKQQSGLPSNLAALLSGFTQRNQQQQQAPLPAPTVPAVNPAELPAYFQQFQAPLPPPSVPVVNPIVPTYFQQFQQQQQQQQHQQQQQQQQQQQPQQPQLPSSLLNGLAA
ncbi:UNVERIFIED_CONTAM: hypothetical protein HDU68_000125, partial [Siphonaria sp. JEL0065]